MAFHGCKLQQFQWKQALRRERWEDYWGSGNLSKGSSRCPRTQPTLLPKCWFVLFEIAYSLPMQNSAPVTLKNSVTVYNLTEF